MKICLISNLYPPYNRGGAEQVVKNTVEGLLARGHEVVVITACPADPSTRSPDETSGSLGRDDKLKIYRFFPLNLFFYGHDYKYPSFVRFFWHIFDVFNLHSYFVVRRILKKERPDIVHTHNLKGLGYLIPAAIRGLGLFHVHTLHDVQLVTPSGIIIKGQEENWRHIGFLTRLYASVCRWLFGNPQVIISPSKFLLEFYKKRGFFPASRKVVLPNPVLEHVTCNMKPVTRDHFIFLYLGQIEEHKGVLFLIKVFRSLFVNFRDPSTPLRSARDDNRCLLHIVGNGSKLEEAKRLAVGCSQIIFHGKVEREALREIFTQTDLTIVPSLCYENSPTVIFESFSFGAPVLASSIEGVAELIRHGENGLTFEAGNEESLLEKLRWCVQNPEKIRGMRSAALKSVEGLGLDFYLDKLLDLCYNRKLS